MDHYLRETVLESVLAMRIQLHATYVNRAVVIRDVSPELSLTMSRSNS
jgi:hypothetical protein